MNQLPDPPPAMWAPHLRRHLTRWLNAMDRRKARQIVTRNENLATYQWRLNYDLWWVEHGWKQGAPTADQVLTQRQRGVTPT